jgi:predicted glycosyltransferase
MSRSLLAVLKVAQHRNKLGSDNQVLPWLVHLTKENQMSCKDYLESLNLALMLSNQSLKQAMLVQVLSISLNPTTQANYMDLVQLVFPE